MRARLVAVMVCVCIIRSVVDGECSILFVMQEALVPELSIKFELVSNCCTCFVIQTVAFHEQADLYLWTRG